MAWIDRPSALINALRVLHEYLTPGPRVCLTGRMMLRARRLLGVHGEDGKWRLDMVDWRSRLELAGIDPDRIEVADERRFAHAMDYMRETETFREQGFLRWLETHEEPTSVPAMDIPVRPHPNARNKAKPSASNEVINERIRRCVG